MKTTLSLESQLDSAGPRASPNLSFSMFFKVSLLDVFTGPPVFRFFFIFSDFGTPSGLPFGNHWDDNWMEKETVFEQGSWEGPRE